MSLVIQKRLFAPCTGHMIVAVWIMENSELFLKSQQSALHHLQSIVMNLHRLSLRSLEDALWETFECPVFSIVDIWASL